MLITFTALYFNILNKGYSLSLTSLRCWWIFPTAVEVIGAASLLPFILQKSVASSKESLGSSTNQNSAPSTKIELSWCPPAKHRIILVADHLKKIFFFCDFKTRKICSLPGLYHSGVFGVFPVEARHVNKVRAECHQLSINAIAERPKTSCTHTGKPSYFPLCCHKTAQNNTGSHRGAVGRPTPAWRRSETAWRRTAWEASRAAETQTGVSRCSLKSKKDTDCLHQCPRNMFSGGAARTFQSVEKETELTLNAVQCRSYASSSWKSCCKMSIETCCKNIQSTDFYK